MPKKVKQSDTESSNPIPYKYIDADNKIYKDPYLNNNNDDLSEEIIPKKSSKRKSKSKKTRKSSKKINKEKLSKEEIYDLIEEKNEEIIDLNKKTNKLKIKLTLLIKQLNETITENAEILYKKDPNPSELKWFKDQYDTKKKTLEIEKKINHSYKVQYNILENKLKARNSLKESKNDTSNLENDVSINKTQSVKSLKTSNKSINVSSSLYMSIEDQINKIKNENKDILTKINNIKNKKVSQKKEMDKILKGEFDIEFKQKNDELTKLQNLRMDAIEKYNTTSKSLEMAKKKIEYFEEKIKKNQNHNKENNEYEDDYNYENEDNSSNEYINIINIIKEEINNKTQEEILEIIKNGQSNLINELKKNNKKIQKKKKNSQDIISTSTDMNNNINLDIKDNSINIEKKEKEKEKEKNKKTNKNIYKIFSLLNSINSNDNKMNKNENIKNENEKLSKLAEDQEILKDLTDIEYRELINKKNEYLETNMRLEKNIKDFLKTENSKLLKVAKSLREKANQLKLIKEKNELIQHEVNNLENIYQLTLEKEKIKEEIEEKMTIKKNIENKKNQDKIVNNQDNEDEINDDYMKKKKNKNKKKVSIDDSNKNKLPDTREEQLFFIKKKYMEEEINNKNININDENNSNELIDNENGNNVIENVDNNNLAKKDIDNNENKEEDIGEIDYNALKLEQVPFKV